MNILPIALVMVSVWLGLLTIVVLVLVRQTGIHSLRLREGMPNFSMDAEGPEVGSVVSPSVVEQLSFQAETVCILALSATCTPCREVAVDLARWGARQPIVALVTGRPDAANALAAALPASIRTIFDPMATALLDELGIRSLPFAVTTLDGAVLDKTYVHQAEDIANLLERSSAKAGLDVLPMEGAR